MQGRRIDLPFSLPPFDHFASQLLIVVLPIDLANWTAKGVDAPLSSRSSVMSWRKVEVSLTATWSAVSPVSESVAAAESATLASERAQKTHEEGPEPRARLS